MENVNAIEEKKEEVSTTVQYIVVKIGNEQYGINIKYIDNIVRKQDITRVPKTQHYYKGVINLRGEIIPVMSVRLKLGLEDDVYRSEEHTSELQSRQYLVLQLVLLLTRLEKLLHLIVMTQKVLTVQQVMKLLIII